MPVELHTPRLLLKGYSPQEIKAVFEQFPKAEIMQQLGHTGDADFETEANKVKNGYAAYNRDFVLFLLVMQSSGEIIGRCGLHNWNREHHRAEIGYHIFMDHYKRMGLMTEAVAAIIPYGFETLQLHRIEALVSADNAASLRLLHRFGFQEEGRLREHYFNNGKFEDSIVFGKLNPKSSRQ